MKHYFFSSLAVLAFTVAGMVAAEDYGDKSLGKNEGAFARTFLKLHDAEIEIPVGAFHRENDFHYVLITGLAGDFVPGYFKFQLDQLRRLGIPERNIHLIRPASYRSTETNLPWLKNELSKIKGKLIILAHSKGANETFALSVTDPDFVERKIHAMYLMQASYLGSPMADELLSHVTHDISSFSPREQRYLRTDKLRGKIMYGFFFRHGLMSTTTRASKELLERLQTANPHSMGVLRSRVFFITSETDDGLTTRILSQYGPSDSINPITSQRVPGWGEHLAHLAADHIGFVLPFGRQREKRALMRAIFTHVETQGEIAKHCPHLFSDDT